MKRTLGQIFGCNSMMGAKIVIEFGKKDGKLVVTNLDKLPTVVQRTFNWERICRDMEEERK